MLSATGIHLSYGNQTVLNDVSLTIDKTTRGGLVGANGSGKTSLLRVLAGIEHPEAGTITQAKRSVVEYLPQRSEIPFDTTVYAYADDGFRREHNLVIERDQLATLLTTDPANSGALHRIAEIDHLLEEEEYYSRAAQIGRVLSGLGFDTTDLQRPLETFSGGWRMRVALARSLLGRPDILLLDEPTNYLDSEARMWLSTFLRSFRGGVLLVSHDRAFLDETVSTVYELFNAAIRRYSGTYTTYETQRTEELEQLVAAWKSQQKEIQRQEDFIRRFRAKATKAKQVQSRVKALEKLDRIELPEHFRPISIALPPPVPSGNTVLTLDGVTKSYGTHRVLTEVSLTLTRGQRLAVVGLNGAGKSTLLRLLSDQEHPETGSISTGTGVNRAYFAQDSADTLPTGVTIFEYVFEHASDAARPHVRDLLGSFLFSGDTIDKPLDVLSGGERSRVAMAALLVRPANLLIMDEPTNHLDMKSQEVLAEALQKYTGTVVVVSHDRTFLRDVATDVLALWPTQRHGPNVPNEHWRYYPGSYREFEGAQLGQVFLDHAATEGRGVPDVREKREQPNNSTGGTQTFAEQKHVRSQLRKVERREEEIMVLLDSLEGEFDALQHQLALPENYRDGGKVQELQSALLQNEDARETLQREWETLEEERRALKY